MNSLAALLQQPGPLLALAPMQDVTDYPFWKLMREYGGPDFYVTEFFRVHGTSSLERHILKSVVENPTGKPVVAQMIGNEADWLVRAARELQKYPVAGIDLNLGCPAPVVYRKCAGGGLLRDPDRVDRILGALRQAIDIPFTVKTRVGFDDPGIFDRMLSIYGRHQLDLLTVHGRTVKEMYGPVVHYDLIARAAKQMPFPVLANGNVDSVESGERVLELTGASGLMIGRGAIRNPWVFEQLRQRWSGAPVFHPKARDLLNYIERLYEAVRPPGLRLDAHVQKMKKYLNFIGVWVGQEFLHEIRRVNTEADFFQTCRRFLDHGGAIPSPEVAAAAMEG